MPSASDLLKKHAERVQDSSKSRPQIKRNGPTRPWQENLEQYSGHEERKDSSESENIEIKVEIPTGQHSELSRDLDVEIKRDSHSELNDLGNFQTLGNEIWSEPGHKMVDENKVKSSRQKNQPVERLSNKGANSSVRDDSSQLEFSKTAKMYTEIIKEFGFDFAMKFLLVRELANSEGLIHCSQQTMANYLDMSLKSVKRLFDDLCDRKAIELYRESDPKTKAPRQYRVLYK